MNAQTPLLTNTNSLLTHAATLNEFNITLDLSELLIDVIVIEILAQLGI